MPVKSVFRAVFFSALLASCPSVYSQAGDVSEQDYRKMLDQAMKSGNYGQNQPQSQSWDARLKVLSGTVMVKTVSGDEWSRVTGEMPLDPNDIVKTSSDGIAEIYLDDKGAVSVGRNTELEVSSLEQEDAVFSLNFGSLVAKVKHFLNEKHKMQVRTPSAVCAVRGTEFAVEYSQLGKDASFAVFDEGRVAVIPTDAPGKESQEYLLEKNTEINIKPDQKRFRRTALSRMSRHRASLSKMRTRLTGLKGWKPRSLSKRAELRRQALKGRLIRKQLKRKSSKARTKSGRGVKKRPAAKRSKASSRASAAETQ